MEPETNQQKSLKAGVYDRIECEHICPRPRTYFTRREYLVWSLWGLSVVVGALAIAVALFVLTHSQYALYEATHDNFLTFVVDILPLLWIAVFLAMLAAAGYNLRLTKHGYRYPLWQIIGSSMVLSLAGGAALQLFGFGYSVDHALGSQMKFYASQERSEETLWQSPMHGRLLGQQTPDFLTTSTTIIFTDAEGTLWSVDVTDLDEQERALLSAEGRVRLLGLVIDETGHVFHSCAAFPWVLGHSPSRGEMREARDSFIARIDEHQRRALEDELQQKWGINESKGQNEEKMKYPCTRVPGFQNSLTI